MVLGFAVVAFYAVAVFSTIIATVTEMRKPVRPDDSADLNHPNHRYGDQQSLPPPLPYDESSLALSLTFPPNGSIGFDKEEFAKHEKQENGEAGGYESKFMIKTKDEIPTGDNSSEATDPLIGGVASQPSSITENNDDDEYYYDDREEKPSDHEEKPSEKERSPVTYVPMYADSYRHKYREKHQQNTFQVPKFPGSGYMTGGIGFSSAGVKPPDAANKAFVPFFGYIDPIVLISIVAFPVLCTLGVTSLMMPLIPILIYIVGLIFPSTKKSKLKLKLQSHNNKTKETVTPSIGNSSRSSSLVSPASINRVLRLLEAAMQKF